MRILVFIKNSGFSILAIEYLDSGNIDPRLRLIKDDDNFWSSNYSIACVAVWDDNPLSLNLRAKDIWPFWSIPLKQIGQYYYEIVPNMDNLRLLIKNSIRVKIESSLPRSLRVKYIHSADNFEEAWEYLEIIMPNKITKIRNKKP